MSFDVHEKEVADFGFYLSAEAAYTLPRIEKLAREEGMSADGFTGLLKPLGDIVNGPASVSAGSAFSLMQHKMCDLGDAVIGVAKTYGYADNDSRTLFERNGLGGDTDEKITTGSGYGFGDGYDRHGKDGESQYKTAELEISPIDRPPTNYSQELDTGAVLSVLDWIWSEFDVDGGKGFTDSLISPLAGNYNSISANGQAWRGVGKNFGLLASAIGDNVTNLAVNHWQGTAAEAFQQFVDLFWHKGAVWAGERLGEFVAKGFDKIAEVAKKIAQLAINAIKLIIEAARKIATKAIPLVGWAWTAIQSAAKYLGWIFGIDIDDLYDDIMQIVETAKAVFGLFDAINNVVETMRNYFTTLEELVDTVKQIPEVGNLKDAAETAGTIRENTGKLDTQKTELEQNLGKADDALTKLDEISTGAG
jgi:phage-related protein